MRSTKYSQLFSYLFQILAVATFSSCQKDDEIIRQDFDGPHDDGSYRWALQTCKVLLINFVNITVTANMYNLHIIS